MINRTLIAALLTVTLLVPLAHGRQRAATTRPNRQKARKKRTGRTPMPQATPTKKIVYKKTKDAKGKAVELNLHVFEPDGHKPADKRAAIVFFFGGGWNGGNPRQFYEHCKYLASRGMWAASAEYRVRSRNGTTPFECVTDGKSAVRYIRANAAKLGLDPKRIAAGGGSAGGHVGACTGTVKGLDEKSEDAAVSSRPDAMVLFNPVVYCGPDGGAGYSRLKDRWKEVSPLMNVSKETPPTIVFHGKADPVVKYANAEKFAKAMKEAGRRCELVGFDGAKHGFFNFGRDGGGAYVKTVRSADVFLASLGFLKGEPTLEPPED